MSERKEVDLKEATVLLGFKYEQYTRRLVLEDKLEARKVAFRGYSKWMVSIDSIDEYNEKIRVRHDNRRYVLRVNPKHEEAIREALDVLDIEYTLEFAYTKKESK